MVNSEPPADGVRVFLEMGPQGSCARMIGKILAGRAHVAIAACRTEPFTSFQSWGSVTGVAPRFTASLNA